MIQGSITQNRPSVVNRLVPFLFFLIFLISSSWIKTLSAQDDPATLFQVCAACHTIGGGRLVGPDLAGVTDRREEAWLIKFIQNSQAMVLSGDPTAVKVFEEYNKIPMPPNALTDDQVRILLQYIKDKSAPAAVATEETAPSATEALPGGIHEEVTPQKSIYYEEIPAELQKKSARNFRAIFLISLFLFFFAILDLAILKILRARFVNIVLILLTLFIMTEIVIVEAQSLGRQQYYSPDQPVKFSHKVHAGQNQINCQYCHFTADNSKHAGIPPVQLCMNCHNLVKQGKKTGTEEINKIYAALESGKSIEWVRVHNLPDHTYFNHAQHVKVGKVDCKECHGPVEEMDRIIQTYNLGMGWCIDCHRIREVQFIDNQFYSTYTRLHEELKSGKISRVTVDDMGGTECQRCHY